MPKFRELVEQATKGSTFWFDDKWAFKYNEDGYYDLLLYGEDLIDYFRSKQQMLEVADQIEAGTYKRP